MDYLGSVGEGWRDEVIRRTKDSPLNVKGLISICLDTNHKCTYPWWLEFFNDNWPRIRKVDLNVSTNISQTWRNVGPWTPRLYTLNTTGAAKVHRALPFLSRSAPALEHFSLSFPHTCDPFETGGTFFNNHAPRITFFEIGVLQFRPQTAWLRQLRGLSLYEFRGRTFKSGDEACKVLQEMPNLEYLALENSIADPSINVHQEFIHLPRLQNLSIRDERMEVLLRNIFNPFAAATYWPLLSRIIPKPGCSVILNLSSSYCGPGRTDVCVLSRFAHNYFQINRPTRLNIVCIPASFRLFDGSRPLSIVNGGPPPAPIFNFSCSLYSQDFPDLHRMMYQAFEAFFELSFSTVTHLCFELATPDAENSWLSCPRMASLLSTFSSVETLTITSITLCFLSQSPAIDISTLFPKLKVLNILIRMGDLVINLNHTQFKAVSIGDFLMLREDAGLDPLSTLKYQSDVDGTIVDDLTALDSFAGLKVVWKTKTIGDGEYICGSGKPEELNFRQKWEATRGAKE